jgi:hypothetical protein
MITWRICEHLEHRLRAKNSRKRFWRGSSWEAIAKFEMTVRNVDGSYELNTYKCWTTSRMRACWLAEFPSGLLKTKGRSVFWWEKNQDVLVDRVAIVMSYIVATMVIMPLPPKSKLPSISRKGSAHKETPNKASSNESWIAFDCSEPIS